MVRSLSFLGQWETEVETRVRTNTLSLYIYHKREPEAKNLARYHIVVTTYRIVASEFLPSLREHSETVETQFAGTSTSTNIYVH